MLAVRPVNPPRPNSSSLRPSRSACNRRGVFPLRRWTKDSMGRLRGEDDSGGGGPKLKVTLVFVLAPHKAGWHGHEPSSNAHRSGVSSLTFMCRRSMRPGPSIADAHHDLSLGG